MNKDQNPENPFSAMEKEPPVTPFELSDEERPSRRRLRELRQAATEAQTSSPEEPATPSSGASDALASARARRAARANAGATPPATPAPATPRQSEGAELVDPEALADEGAITRRRRRSRLHVDPNIPLEREEPAGNIANTVELEGLRRRRDKGRGRVLLPEEYAGMHAELERASSPSRCFIVGITSAVYGEGKTTVAMNLAGTMAQNSTQRIALVDCNLRNWDLQLRLNLPPCAGLVDYLEGQEEEVENIVQYTELENFVIVPAGRAAVNPSRLARSDKLNDFMAQLRSKFDFVVMDLAPMLPVADARVLSRFVDGLIFVVRAGVTPREVVTRAIESVGSDRVLGVVLNGTEVSMPRFLQRYFQ